MSRALKTMACVNPVTPRFDALPNDAEVTFMPLETVWADGKADTSRRAVKSGVANSYTRFDSGDILLPKVTPTFEAGRVFPAELDTEAGVGSTELHVLRAKPGFDPRYVAYVCRSQPFLQEGATTLEGVGNLRRVPASFVGKFQVFVEDFSHQVAIAEYLDAETAKIDALIEKQASLIGALRARRQEAVRYAVLGHDRPPMKAVHARSPWVPEIPSTWDFVPLGYQYNVVLGKMLDAGRAPREGDTDLPYIRAANIQDAGLDLSSVNSMPFTPLEAIKFSLRSGDLLVVEGGSVGVSVVLEDDMKGWAFQKTVNRVRSRGDSSTRYLHYVLNAYRNAGVFGIICGGSTIAHLMAEKLAALRIPVPPLGEQREIVDRLNRETARIDELIAKSERLIKLSQERRAALITAAVTGQIDVARMDARQIGELVGAGVA